MAASGILPGHWYYNTESGELTHGNNLENLGNNLFGGLSWHELNISGNATQAQAAAEAQKEFPTGTPPTTSISTGVANQVQQETGLTGINAIGAFFNGLGNGNTWIRVAKVVVGGTLIIVGVARLSGTGKAVKDIAGKVPVIPV